MKREVNSLPIGTVKPTQILLPHCALVPGYLRTKYGERGKPCPCIQHFEGSADPAEELMWNGRGNTGELAQSDIDYPYVYTVTDALGNTSTKTGAISIDVLVIREGDQFRIQIPSIVFPADSAVFDGLNQSTLDNNNRVINRVARNRLLFSGAGDSMPIVPFEDHSGWWKNRRVDFILIR